MPEDEEYELMPHQTIVNLKHELEVLKKKIGSKEQISSSEVQKNIEKLKKLRELGFTIAIDDFGTGFSSLSKLQDYPIDTLKIDRSFIKNVIVNEKTSAITKHIINIGRDLGFKVVAEGVETKEEYDVVREVGIDAIQGYYLYRPSPIINLDDIISVAT